MEYQFERPPRWDPARPERPAVVYLDQWCWDQLVRDRAGDLDDTHERASPNAGSRRAPASPRRVAQRSWCSCAKRRGGRERRAEVVPGVVAGVVECMISLRRR